MEPVRPTPSVDAQPIKTPQPDAQASTGGRFSRVTGFAKGALGLHEQPTGATTAPSFDSAATAPGLQPRPDTTPAAVVPSPWANPDVAAASIPPSLASIAEPKFRATPVAEPAGVVPALPEDPFAPKTIVEPTSITIPEPTATPDPLTSPTVESAAVAPALPEDPLTPKAATEPVVPAPEPTPVIPTTEPTVIASPVWEQSPTDSGTDSIIVDPDMRTSSTPSVEPTTATTNPEDTADAAEKTNDGQAETPEPPMFRKKVDGDHISYEFTPEGRDRMMAAFAKAVDSGAFNDLAGMFASGQGSEPEAQNTETTTPPPTEPQPATSPAELPPPNPAAQPDWGNPGQPITRGPV